MYGPGDQDVWGLLRILVIDQKVSWLLTLKLPTGSPRKQERENASCQSGAKTSCALSMNSESLGTVIPAVLEVLP